MVRLVKKAAFSKGVLEEGEETVSNGDESMSLQYGDIRGEAKGGGEDTGPVT